MKNPLMSPTADYLLARIEEIDGATEGIKEKLHALSCERARCRDLLAAHVAAKTYGLAVGDAITVILYGKKSFRMKIKRFQLVSDTDTTPSIHGVRLTPKGEGKMSAHCHPALGQRWHK